MRFVVLFLIFLVLPACSTMEVDRTTLSVPTLLRTKVTFEPLTREQAQRYLEAERQFYKDNTALMRERKEGLERGREERYREVSGEFPECGRQKHCMQHLSKASVKRFERYNALAREIYVYDKELAEIGLALRDWDERLSLRSRAILNRFLVHELLQLPRAEPRFQGVLAYSLESFESKRLLTAHLLRVAGSEVEPRVIGDYDFRMLGRPLDEAAVIATLDVYLMPQVTDMEQPTRFLVSFLVNTHQLDLRFYDKDFLGSWGTLLAEPYQKKLREQVYCGLYSIAGETLAPRLGVLRPSRCSTQRNLMRYTDAARLMDRFPPDRWLLPVAYFPIKRGDR